MLSYYQFEVSITPTHLTMAFVRNLFGAKPSAPETIPTDTIIPLFERDDSTTNRAVALEFTMVFDDVLDADKLGDALWRLLEKPGWKKLGARLRLNVIKPTTKNVGNDADIYRRKQANSSTMYPQHTPKTDRLSSIRTKPKQSHAHNTISAKYCLVRMASSKSVMSLDICVSLPIHKAA